MTQIRRRHGAMLAGWVLLAVAIAPIVCWAQAKHRLHTPHVVGWHDELNDLSLWKPVGADNPPDIYATHPGRLTLRLPHVPAGYPYEYQWSGVARSIMADLNRFPVLAAHVSSLAPGSYAHLDVEEHGFGGRTVRTWRSTTLTRPGVTSVDLGKEFKPGMWRLTVRLIVGGKLAGAKCDYNWVRFVRREDTAYFQEVPDSQDIRSEEPAATAPASPKQGPAGQGANPGRPQGQTAGEHAGG